MNDTPTPIAIRRESANAIEIEFDDGKVVHWTARQLRNFCPCATCREKKRGDDLASGSLGDHADVEQPTMLPVISQAEARPLTIEGMRPVGQYGYNIYFSDGHASGIFQFAMLYQANDS